MHNGLDHAEARFRSAIQAAGLPAPETIHADGKIHRFGTSGKRGDDSGWYVLHADGLAAGAFGCWRSGLSQDWCAESPERMPVAQREAYRQRMEAVRAVREQEQAERHQRAAEAARALLARSKPGDHPYLTAKGIAAYGMRVDGEHLLIPMRDASGELHNVQRIAADGQKRFLSGGRVKGCYCPIGKPTDTLVVCEGFATGASIHEATGLAVAVSFTAGNLLPVAEALRQKYQTLAIVIAADDDYRTEGNPGLTKAREAAAAVGGRVAVPVFPESRGERDTDFNDLHRVAGLEAVRAGIESASHPGVTEWVEPLPLPKLPPVPEFPLEVLPDAFGPWIADAADRARFRPDLSAVASMAALGTLIGRKLGIRLKAQDNWTEYANVWALLVGPPSALKSHAYREAMRPFKALQIASDAEFKQRLDEYRQDSDKYKIRADARRKSAVKALANDPDADIDLDAGDKPEEPVARAYWTSNVSAEALGVLLSQNTNGVLIERDELSSLLSGLEHERNSDLRGLLLSGWSGNESYRFDRITRDMTSLPKFALSVCGGIQPGPIAKYVRGAYSGERADGLLQRFQLLTWPEPEEFEYVDRYPNSAACKAADEVFKVADTFDPVSIGTKDDFGNPPYIRLAPAAQEMFVDWYTGFMRGRGAAESSGAECSALAAHFGKYPGLLGKLALALHIADDPGSRQVSQRTLLKALGWLQYLDAHARRVYHCVDRPETGAAELLLARLKRKELPPSFKCWQITRKGWQGLGDGEAVKKAARLLFEHGWLVEIDHGGATGGRPADVTYAVAPGVRFDD